MGMGLPLYDEGERVIVIRENNERQERTIISCDRKTDLETGLAYFAYTLDDGSDINEADIFSRY